MNQERRYSIIEVINSSEALIDLDITTQSAELAYAKEHCHTLNIIASYHNYLLTPETKHLKEIIDTMEPYNPFIYKIATNCIDEHSAFRLLHLLLELKDNNRRAIVLGMGQQGKITRICGLLWGNELTFAPVRSDGASASGQLTRAQYERLLKELGY